uniref:Uncharacterized protein n=1 Tax=Ditylenchus dipsaci TaxID=166011 RepID=A0A915DHB7_9BILA
MFLSCDILLEVLCFDCYESCSKHLLTSKLFSVAVFERIELQRNRLKETVKEMQIETKKLKDSERILKEVMEFITKIGEEELPAALKKFVTK